MTPARCGYEPSSGMYYEVLGVRSPGRPPLVLIHGGAGTGAVFRVTVDGRPGWAEELARRGEEVWIADWPGSGRSAAVDPLAVDYETVVGAFVALLRDAIGVPSILVGHSMGGSIAWRVAELARALVVGVVGLAPSPPGNLGSPAHVVSSRDGDVRIRHPDLETEIPLRLDRPFVTQPEYVEEQWIAPSERLPREHADGLRRTVVPMSPLLALQRLGGDGGIPAVDDTAAYEGLWIRIVVAPNDPGHTRQLKQPIVDLFSSWGADAKLVHLGDRGVDGNGHFMFAEVNSEDVLAVVLEELAARKPVA